MSAPGLTQSDLSDLSDLSQSLRRFAYWERFRVPGVLSLFTGSIVVAILFIFDLTSARDLELPYLLAFLATAVISVGVTCVISPTALKSHYGTIKYVLDKRGLFELLLSERAYQELPHLGSLSRRYISPEERQRLPALLKYEVTQFRSPAMRLKQFLQSVEVCLRDLGIPSLRPATTGSVVGRWLVLLALPGLVLCRVIPGSAGPNVPIIANTFLVLTAGISLYGPDNMTIPSAAALALSNCIDRLLAAEIAVLEEETD